VSRTATGTGAARRRPAMRSACALTALALVTACSAGARSQEAAQAVSGSTMVAPDRASSLHLPGGLKVSVPRGAVAGDGTLLGATVSAPESAPQGMTLSGPTYYLRITRTRLTGKVRLTVPVPSTSASGPAAEPGNAMLAFYDTAEARWQPLAATYDPATRSLVAMSPHLSIWSVLRLNASKVLAQATSLLKGFIGVADATAQPTCPRANELNADGITVASDKGNLIRWCAGVGTDRSPLLQIADNRSYAMETEYPAAWSASRIGPADPITRQIISSVTHVLSPASDGAASIIIPGGGTVQFEPPAGTLGEARTEPSPEGYLFDAFLYGADTLAMTMGDVPGAPKSDPAKTAQAISLAFAAKDCVTQVDAMAHDNLSNAHAVGELFRSDVELAVGCLGDEWRIAYGLKGFVGSFIASVVLWLTDGIKLVLNGLKAAIDTGIYWRSYRIALDSSTASSLASYAGQWYVHGAMMAIDSDGSGKMTWNAGPCSQNINVDEGMCTGHASITFKPVSVGISGTVTNVWYTASSGSLPPDFRQPTQPTTNESFTLKMVNADVLYATWYSNPTMNEGNRNWCRPGYINSQVCGA
jgi:hypothetical protein